MLGMDVFFFPRGGVVSELLLYLVLLKVNLNVCKILWPEWQKITSQHRVTVADLVTAFQWKYLGWGTGRVILMQSSPEGRF